MIETLFNLDPILIATFIGAGLLLNLTPGADFLLVTSSTIRSGAQVGRAAAVGINLGVLVHLIMATAGLSALLLAYPTAFEVIRYAGAVYLLWMAWQIWNDDGKLGEGAASVSIKAALRRGVLTNILNPKTALFIFAFIPQFTDPALGPIWHQMTILGAIFLVNGFIFEMVLVAMVDRLGPVLRRHLGILNKLTAILFGGLAARLVLE